MDSQKRRLLSINLLLQLAASDPTPMGADGLALGARAQAIHSEDKQVESVLLDLAREKLVEEIPQRLVREIHFFRITTDGRAYLRESGFKLPE